MKNALANRIFRRVSITHGIVILLTIILPLARCARKPKEVVTFFDLAGAPPPPAAEFEPEETPDPEPKPVPPKKPALEPVITNTPPKKTETKKPAVTNAPPKKAETNAPAKPKTLEERLKEVREGGKKVKSGKATAARPNLDLSGIRAALNSTAAGSGSGTAASGTGSGSGGGMYSPFAGYYDSVKQQMYAVWQQPAGAPIGLTATASIRVERNGTVSLKSITRHSGNAQFDQSVQKALNATVRLPVPPPDLPDRNISIEFVLSD